MKYTLTEVKPKIFFLNFKDYYDMCMLFLRYQEFYESLSLKFRGKQFKILDFMEWYSKKHGGSFTYTLDWAGFNIPGKIISEVRKKKILDYNNYDAEMFHIYGKCYAEYGNDFYLISAVGENESLKHEIAHGFFYTFPEYKKEMTKLVKALDSNFRSKFNLILKNMGYTSKVYIDECQAYLSTGTYDIKGFDNMKLNGEDKPFIELYNKYYENYK